MEVWGKLCPERSRAKDYPIGVVRGRGSAKGDAAGSLGAESVGGEDGPGRRGVLSRRGKRG
jgi:hypothetical protein